MSGAVNGERARPDGAGDDRADNAAEQRRRALMERLAHRRRDRLTEGFRRSNASTLPTWVYAVALALMVGAIAALVIIANTTG